MSKSFILLPAIGFMLILVTSFTNSVSFPLEKGAEITAEPEFPATAAEITAEPEFPPGVGTIITTSCYDCHTTGAKAKKAVDALDFKLFNEYRLTKRISLLNDICEEVSEGHMPPKKYLGFNPEKALSDEDVKLICDWTKEAAAKLME